MSSDATSQPPPLTLAAPPPSSKTSLAPGFRFHPTDEELVSYYLKRKIANRPFRVDAISELDLYKSEPWDLPGKSRIRSRDMEWYFFSPLDRKYANRSRTSRTTGVGYWKTTGKDRVVKRGARTVGMKKTLVFHVGKAPKGTRTNWVMHEYRLGDDSEAGRSQEPEYVVCRIFQKNGAGPQNGAQYGAPFVEEEWEEEDNSGLVAMKEDGEDESRIDFGDELFMPSDDFEDENKAVDILKEDADPLLGSNDGSIIDRTTVGSANLNSNGNNSKDSESSAEMSELDNNNDSNGFSDVQLPEILQNQGLPQDDYLELNDFTDFFDVELFSGEDLAVCKEESNSIQGSTGQLSELINIEELSENCNNVDSTEPGQMQMPFTVDDNHYFPFQDKFYPLVGDYSSHNQAEEGMMYFDAPSNNSVAEHDYDWTNDFLHTEVPDPSEPDLLDELMTYFDATEDGLLYSMEDRETFDSTNLQSIQSAPEVAVPQTSNIANSLEVFGGYSGSKRENNTVIPDGHSGNGWDKRLKKHLVGMLESISSPPALAAEYPAKEVEYLKLNPASHSSRSISLAGGVIYMDAWDKFPPYGVSKNAVASDSVEAYGEGRKEEHCGIISMLIRSGFCVSFLSILFLGVSYKLGFCVCSSSKLTFL